MPVNFVVRHCNLVLLMHWDAQAHGVSAALEFGVMVLRLKHRFVGHAQCAA